MTLLLSEVLERDPATGIHFHMCRFLEERKLLAVRVEVHLVTSTNFLHASFCQTQKTRFVKLDAANYGHRLREEVLPLVVVVHIHAGKEHVVLWMSVNPPEEYYILSVMHIGHILRSFHCAGVRFSSLLWNDQMRYDKSVVPQAPPKGA